MIDSSQRPRRWIALLCYWPDPLAGGPMRAGALSALGADAGWPREHPDRDLLSRQALRVGAAISSLVPRTRDAKFVSGVATPVASISTIGARGSTSAASQIQRGPTPLPSFRDFCKSRDDSTRFCPSSAQRDSALPPRPRCLLKTRPVSILDTAACSGGIALALRSGLGRC